MSDNFKVKVLMLKGEKGSGSTWGDIGGNLNDQKDLMTALNNAATGKTPVRGTDYWTADDIATIKTYCQNAILNGEW